MTVKAMCGIGMLALLWALPVGAASGAAKCEAAKNKLAGKYAACRQKAVAKAILSGAAADYSRCSGKFPANWQKAEDLAAALMETCPDEPLAVSDMQIFIDAQTGAVAAALHGGAVPTCGNNATDLPGEQCDGPALGGATCGSLGFGGGTLACTAGCKLDTSGCGGACVATDTPLRTGQMTCYDNSGPALCAGTGQDGELQRGSARNSTDNGDGTITDHTTGLMWEKLCTGGPCPVEHDVNTASTWANAFAKIAAMNSAVYAGHSDWRLPNVNELQTLAKYAAVNPAIDTVFNTNCTAPCSATACSCTQPLSYWSSTTWQFLTNYAWVVSFDYGNVKTVIKTNDSYYTRAVRGGS